MARTKIRNQRILLAAGAILLVVIAFAIWSRAFVDPKALVLAHEQRIFDEVKAGAAIDVRAQKKALAHFHKGPPPCASYDEPAPVADEELSAIARDLRGAQMLDRVRDESALFWRWGNLDEERRHGPVTDEELLEAFSMTASLYERAVSLFAGHAIADALRARKKQLEAAEEARARDEERALSHHELEALQGIWIRHPIAMSFPSYVQTMARLPRE